MYYGAVRRKVKVNESRWDWNSDTKTMAHCMKSSLLSFGVTVGFTVLKNSLDYLKRLVS